MPIYVGTASSSSIHSTSVGIGTTTTTGRNAGVGTVTGAMVFNVDTTFLTLSKNPRDQKSYEQDVVRINLIDPEDLITWIPKNKNHE